MRAIGALMLTVLLSLASGALACPNCKNAQLDEGFGPSARMRDGYLYSYFFMTSMPFLMIGGIATLLFYHARKQRSFRQASEGERHE